MILRENSKLRKCGATIHVNKQEIKSLRKITARSQNIVHSSYVCMLPLHQKVSKWTEIKRKMKSGIEDQTSHMNEWMNEWMKMLYKHILFSIFESLCSRRLLFFAYKEVRKKLYSKTRPPYLCSTWISIFCLLPVMKKIICIVQGIRNLSSKGVGRTRNIVEESHTFLLSC